MSHVRTTRQARIIREAILDANDLNFEWRPRAPRGLYGRVFFESRARNVLREHLGKDYGGWMKMVHDVISYEYGEYNRKHRRLFRG